MPKASKENPLHVYETSPGAWEQVTALADDLLDGIAQQKARLAELDAEVEREFAAVRARYAPAVTEATKSMEQLHKVLTSVMEENKEMLFAKRDTVKLAAGLLLYGKQNKVSLPRDALARVLEAGFNDAVKIAKSLDRKVIEDWPDDRLFLIGGRRKLVEKFNYEVNSATKLQQRHDV
jgi:phage host-nuclease inhibitor protein Gam